MGYLRKYAEAMGAFKPNSLGATETINEADEEDEEVPDLVENFEEAAAK